MLPELARDRSFVRRFRSETLLLAALTHENIVSIYDLVEKNRQLFIVMEYVDGINVRELINGGPLPLDISLIIADGVASALEHAHFHRVIHRDIKPSNVMLSTRGQVKLTDFGIAKDLQGDDLTRTGLMVGTPSYLAPELLGGKRVNALSDIYAVGVLLFCCITGKRPFGERQGQELYAAIAKGDRPRLRELVPSYSRAVDKLVERCLELDPEKRWRNAAELRGEVQRLLGKELDSTPAARVVTFLYERGHARQDHLATLAFDELKRADTSLDLSTVIERPLPGSTAIDEAEPEPVPGRQRRISWLAIVLLLLALGAGAAAMLAPETFYGLVERVIEQIERLSR
jgi:serine/threonine-protein kinase